MFLCLLLNILVIVGREDWPFDSMDVEALKKINKSKIKKLVKKYYAFLASVPIIKQIPCFFGPGFDKAGKCSVYMLVTCVLAGLIYFLTSCG
jgi:hypothetical protein